MVSKFKKKNRKGHNQKSKKTIKPKSLKTQIIKFILIALISISVYFFPINISNEALIVLSILIFASLLWITETIPLFLTSLIISILLVLFGIFSFKDGVTKFADPILILFFGGFLIAIAMQNLKLDSRIALKITSKFKNDHTSLLVMMFVTAILSMWISNTASTLIMIPIALGIVAKFHHEMTNFTKASVLGIAYSANIGGIGTIIGSPPNAITVSKLSEIAGIQVTFFEWMIRTLPIYIILIPICWFLLMKIFPYKDENLKIKKPRHSPLNKTQKLFLIIFGITIILWMTTRFTGLSSSLIAILSATSLLLVGLLKPSDINKVNYQVLILFGGGLVLGSAMFETGLSDYFATGIASLLQGYPLIVIIFGIIIFSIAMGALASNTATAAILIPVLIPVASVLSISPKMLAMLGGIAVSLDFLLPVGTPPNAIAYATGKVSIFEMLKAGILITIVSIIVLALVARFLWI